MKTESITQTIAALAAAAEAPENAGDFIEGHGLQSRRFRFSWSDEALSIEIDLPCCRVLSDDEDRMRDNEEIAAACQMGRLLLAVRDAGVLLREGETRLVAVGDDDGARYRVTGADGETADEGDGWDVLAARLDTVLPAANAGGLDIIWP